MVMLDQGTSDNIRTSRYYRKHKTSPSCPFCGYKMVFTSYRYYEEYIANWSCKKCGCALLDSEDYTEEQRSQIRTQLRAYFKSKIRELERALEHYRKSLAFWGKYMSDKEKVRLLAEALFEDRCKE